MDAHRPPGAPLRVALFGLGGVGSAVAARLIDPAWQAGVAARGVLPPELVALGVRDPERPRGITLPDSVRRTDDLTALATDPGVDVIIELLGGTEVAGAVIRAAMAAGKQVVTANKMLLAKLGPSLELAARAAGIALRFEAAVGGGIPVLSPLVLDLAANHISAVRGIVNGTTNHVLTAMAQDGRAYQDVLAEAQARGYAEADPASDVEGHDAADKLAILTRLSFGGWPDVEALRRSVPTTSGDAPPGITGVRPVELARAADLGLAIKLVARAERRRDGAVWAAVTPVAVRAGSPLGSTWGVTNLVEIIAEPVGRVAFRGPGAGGPATSSAVLADVLAIARGEGSTWEPLPPAAEAPAMVDDLEVERGWFFVADRLPGGQLPARLADLALARSEEAVVTRPMSLAALRYALIEAGVEATLYPVISEA